MKRIGFGQVEPNHLSAQRTSQIYAQLPAKSDINVLENGQYVKYDYANGEVNFTGAGEWMMVFNEVKLYDDFWKESYKDYAMQAKDFTPGSDSITHDGVGPFKGQMTPRVIKTNIGDIYTTNMVETGKEYAVGDELQLKKVENTGSDNVSTYNTLVLAKDAGDTVSTIKFVVAKVYTMPDGQPGLKLQRIA